MTDVAARSEPEYLSIGRAANALGLAKSTLARQIEAGSIRRHPEGVILAEVIEDRATNLRKGNRKSGRPSRKPQPTTSDKPQPGARDQSGPEDSNFAAAAAIDKKYAAKLRKLEYEERSGKLIERELAERVFFDAARDIRDAWLTWPARIAPLLAAELGIEARTLNTRLTEHVICHLTELGAPDAGRLKRPLS